MAEIDIIREFQARRQATMQQQKPWFVTMLVGWAGVVITFGIFLFRVESPSPEVTVGLFFVSLVMLATCVVRINFNFMRSYHCPACGSIPVGQGSRGGVALDPEECPRCGVRLK